MAEAVELLVGAFVCLVPVGAGVGLLFILFWSRRSKGNGRRHPSLMERVRQLEQRVRQLEEVMVPRDARHTEEAPTEARPSEALGSGAQLTARKLSTEPRSPTPEARHPLPETESASDADSRLPSPASDPRRPLPEPDTVAETDSPPPDSDSRPATPAPVSETRSPSPDPRPPSPAARSAAAPRQRRGMEQWLGISLASALAAGLLILAGVFLFRHAVSHGWLTPGLRVAFGAALGLFAIVASQLKVLGERWRAASWLAGAGFGVLYSSAWAAHQLYDLISVLGASALMVAITAAAVALSSRRRSAVLALVSMLGGFLTPLLLATERDQPIHLFTYLVLLNAGLLWLSRTRNWPWLGLISLGATALYEVGWLADRLTDSYAWLGASIIAVFGLLFAVVSAQASHDAPVWRRVARYSAILPALFVLVFAGRLGVASQLPVTAALLVVLNIGAAVLARRLSDWAIARWATSVSIVTVAVLGLSDALTASLAWQLSAVGVAVALVHYVGGEFARRDAVATRPLVYVGGLAAVGMLVATIVAAVGSHFVFWPWLAGWAFLTVLALRLGTLGAPALLWLAPFTVASGLSLWGVLHLRTTPLSESIYCGAVGVFALTMQGVAFVVRTRPWSAQLERGAYLLSLVSLSASVLWLDVLIGAAWPPWLLLVVLVLALQLSCTRSGGRWTWMLNVFFAVAAVGAWLEGGPDYVRPWMIAALSFNALIFAGWPLLVGNEMRSSNGWLWRSSALGLPLFFFPIYSASDAVWPTLPPGLVPALMAAVGSVLALAGFRLIPAREAPARATALVWLVLSCAWLAGVALTLQFEKEWLTVALAIEATVMVALWYRLDRPALKYVGTGLLVAVWLRLVANPWVVDYHAPSGWPVLNWLAYAYLVPAVLTLLSGRLLARRETDRVRPAEQRLLGAKRAWLAGLCHVAGGLIVFVWITLSVTDAFALGRELGWPVDRYPARDLTMSMAWALYALVLLGLGLWRRSRGLRVASLVLMYLTCAKVFLYDLSHLEDLYRVASLVGLAFVLLVISFLYQRFVFRRVEDAEQVPEGRT